MTNEVKTKTQEAVEHLSKELLIDNGYWFAWQSNIAVAFLDQLSYYGYKLPDQHKIANDAAVSFLNNLTNKHRGNNE